MEKILLLSCSAGQGHNVCGRALRETLEETGAECRMVDCLEFIDEDLPGVISHGHSFVYRHLPDLFQWGYEYCGRHPSLFQPGSRVHKFLMEGADALREYLEEEEIGQVLCTHVFPAVVLTYLLREEPLPVDTAFISTDYTCHPGVEVCEMDRYFIPDGRLRGEFADRGIPDERLTVTGIPVRREFRRRTDRGEAKAALGLDPEKRHLLLMCGSMGCGPMRELTGRLARETGDEMELTVVCGTNKRLRRELERWYREAKGVHILGYSDQISLYMDASDLYLTKPGGISVTEAAAKGLPMVFVNAVAGCEQYNLDFFAALGGAATAKTPKRLTELCLRLLRDPERLGEMARALGEITPPDSGERAAAALRGEAVEP